MKKRQVGIFCAAAAMLVLSSGATWALDEGRVSVLGQREGGPHSAYAQKGPQLGPAYLPIVIDEPGGGGGGVGGGQASAQSQTDFSAKGAAPLGGATLSPFGAGGSIGESRDAAERSLKKTIRRLG